MKNVLFLSALIIFSNCNRMRYEQRLQRQGKIKCGWYGKMNAQERRAVFPFNEAHKVLLISFPNYEVEDIKIPNNFRILLLQTSQCHYLFR